MPDAGDTAVPHPRRPSLSLLERWPRVTDLLLATLALAGTLLLWTRARDAGAWGLDSFPGIAAYLCAFTAHLALLWRRTHPFRVHAALLLATVAVHLLGQTHGLVGMVVSLYSLGRYEIDRRWSIAGSALAFVLVITDLEFRVVPGPGAWLTGVLVVMVWYTGRRLRFRGEYLRLLEERAAQMEREREAEAERAVVAERTRIAREMHDVIAHQVSVMTVQAGAARTVLRADPDAAISAIAAVEQAGRQALSEMRHLLGVLRQDESGQALDPQPGIAELAALFRRVADAGPVVTPTLRGALDTLPARAQLAIYRIVQEALTNVIKHAGPDARVKLHLELDDETVRLSIVDDGKRSSTPTAGGHGIAGMRERAALLGGWLTAGRGDGGGFEVRAVLPRGGEPE